MQTLPYSQLTQAQRAQVAYLFADQHFGSDAGAFLYEVNKQGVVIGRAMDGEPQTAKGRSRRGPVQVTCTQEVNVTQRMIFNAQMNMDALAASIAAKLNQQSQIEEVIK